MRKFFGEIRNVWAAKDIRVKILFTMFILVLYRLGTAIPVPYVKNEVLASLFSGSGIYSGTIFQYLNQLNGGALAQATLFALGISPYITASIVMQLLAVAFPKLERMSKDENGKKKISQITRYVTVALGALTAWGYFSILKAQQSCKCRHGHYRYEECKHGNDHKDLSVILVPFHFEYLRFRF